MTIPLCTDILNDEIAARFVFVLLRPFHNYPEIFYNDFFYLLF